MRRKLPQEAAVRTFIEVAVVCFQFRGLQADRDPGIMDLVICHEACHKAKFRHRGAHAHLGDIRSACPPDGFFPQLRLSNACGGLKRCAGKGWVAENRINRGTLQNVDTPVVDQAADQLRVQGFINLDGEGGAEERLCRILRLSGL